MGVKGGFVGEGEGMGVGERIGVIVGEGVRVGAGVDEIGRKVPILMLFGSAAPTKRLAIEDWFMMIVTSEIITRLVNSIPLGTR